MDLDLYLPNVFVIQKSWCIYLTRTKEAKEISFVNFMKCWGINLKMQFVVFIILLIGLQINGVTWFVKISQLASNKHIAPSNWLN